MTHGMSIMERAFQLAEGGASLDEIKTKLKREGYSNVDAHLSGGSVRADLKRAFKQ